MVVYVLFVHKKLVSKRKVCIIYIKNLKLKKTKNPIISGFLGGFFWVGFLGGFLLPTLGVADPVYHTTNLGTIPYHSLESGVPDP
jgi:hypothetical protein